MCKDTEEPFIPFKQDLDIPPPPMMKQDMNRLRNAIHNEAGVTKQEIRDMVEQAVKHIVEKKVKQLLPDQASVDKMVDRAIEERSLYYWKSDGAKFASEIQDTVAKLLVKKLNIEVKTK